MSVAQAAGKWTDEALAEQIRDHLRLQIVGMGHNTRDGSVHVSDNAIMANVGKDSLFNRATALDLSQIDTTLAEVAEFFGPLRHSLWLEDATVDALSDEILRSRGYRAMTVQPGMALTDMPEHEVGEHGIIDPAHHADLLTTTEHSAAAAEVIAPSFGLGVDDRLQLEDLARSILRHARPWHHGALYGVRGPDKRLRAVTVLLCTTESAGLSAIAVHPTERHHGYAADAAMRALHDAKALGYSAACALATPDSEPLLRTIGFRPILNLRIYRQVLE